MAEEKLFGLKHPERGNISSFHGYMVADIKELSIEEVEESLRKFVCGKLKDLLKNDNSPLLKGDIDVITVVEYVGQDIRGAGFRGRAKPLAGSRRPAFYRPSPKEKKEGEKILKVAFNDVNADYDVGAKETKGVVCRHIEEFFSGKKLLAAPPS